MAAGIVFERTGLSVGSTDAVVFAPALINAGAKTTASDRKSTRLNSSHANISYAVFCLKQKRRRRGLTPGCNGAKCSNGNPSRQEKPSNSHVHRIGSLPYSEQTSIYAGFRKTRRGDTDC